MEPKLRSVGRLRLVDDVRRTLEESILAGRIRPGERLAETWLAQELHVSRTTVREALLMLQRQGHVVSLPRRGTYVMRLSQAEAADLCNIRALLEGYAVCSACLHLDATTFDRLQACISDMAALRLTEDLPRLVQIDLTFHRILVEQAHSSRLTDLFSNLDGQVGALVIRAVERYQADIADFVARHQQLLDSVRSGDPALAQQAVIDHYVTGAGREERGRALSEGLAALEDAIPGDDLEAER
jgi:DNA-binding GntR family transcriptional regulator